MTTEEAPLDFRIPKPDPQLLLKGLRNLPSVLRMMGFDSLRPGQDAVVNSLLGGVDTLCIMPTAGGKCLARDTPVILFSGKVVPVQDVRIGDLLLGPDSEPRKVVSLARGIQDMFRVTQEEGDAYTVNRDHILSLKIDGIPHGRFFVSGDRAYRNGDLVNMTVHEYLRQTMLFKKYARGWMPDGGVGFSGQEPLAQGLSPRDLGTRIGNMCAAHRGVDPSQKDPFIPDAFLRASKEDRLQLLGSLLEACGQLQEPREDGDSLDLEERVHYDIQLRSPELADQVQFLARSLGFRAGRHQEIITRSTWEAPVMFHTVRITGGLSRIPRVSPIGRVDSRYDSPAETTGINVCFVGTGDYYGFELEGPDRLFLLGDFTVTHNTACFVIPALCHDWRLLVFCPLKALMRDQVKNLQAKGLVALKLDSDNNESENSRNMADWASGDCKILYVAPERLANPAFQNIIKHAPPDMICVDEVHCLSAWTDNFRHSYTKIGDVIEAYKPRVVAGFTATFSEEVEGDVRRVLRLPDAVKMTYYPRRKNLILSSSNLDDCDDLALRVSSVKGKVLIYNGTRKRVEETAARLSRELNMEVGFYHSTVKETLKQSFQDAFYDGRLKCMVATNAFGMGVDIPDIRSVIHVEHAGDPEALSQEIGRAGRDGDESFCHTYESRYANKLHTDFIRNDHPTRDIIARYFRAVSQVADANGMYHLTYDELVDQTGIDQQCVGAIVQQLLGSKVIMDCNEGVRVHKVRFKDPDCKLVKYLQMEDLTRRFGAPYEYDPSMTAFDLDVVAGQTSVGPTTIRKYLVDWRKQGLVDYEPPPTGKPKRIIGDLNLVDFSRLEEKRTKAYEKLDYVRGYFQVPDEEKHSYLEAYFTKH